MGNKKNARKRIARKQTASKAEEPKKHIVIIKNPLPRLKRVASDQIDLQPMSPGCCSPGQLECADVVNFLGTCLSPGQQTPK